MIRARIAVLALVALAAACSDPSPGDPPPGDCLAQGCPEGQACDAVTGACTTIGAGCGSGASCPGATPVCDAGACVQCATVADCAPGTYACTGNGRCARECTTLMLPPPVNQLCSPFGFLRSFCTTDADCGATEPHCVEVSWGFATNCVACLGHDECSGPGERCVSGDCVVPFPGDGCEAPVPLALSATETLVTADLRGYSHECIASDPACDPDVFYAFTVTAESVLDAVADGVGGADVARIELLSACGQPFADSNWADAATGEVGFAGRVLPPGDYLLHLAMQPGIDMAFTLRATLAPVGTAPGESCTWAIPIVPGAAGEVSVTGDTFGHPQPSPDACDTAQTNRPETVYALDLAVPSLLDLTLTPASSDARVGLAIKSDCGSAAAEAQACGFTTYAPPHARLVPLAAGRQYVVVTSTTAAGGAYTLTGTVGPWPANDFCAAPEPLAFTAGVATVHGQTLFATWEEGNTCSTCPLGGSCSYSKDVFYSFSTVGSGVRSLDVALTPTAATGWKPKVVLSKSCTISLGGPNKDGLACGAGAAGAGATFGVDLLPEGTDVLQVGGDGGGAPFDMEVRLGAPRYPPPANDACLPPVPAYRLAPASPGATGSTVTLRGTTIDANADLAATCGGAGGGDVVYELKLPYTYEGQVLLRVQPLGAGFDPVVVSESSCAAAGGECANASGAGAAETLDVVVPNTSYVWVSGAGGTSGDFDLTATFVASTPGFDVCGSSFLLASPGSVSASTAAAFPDVTCQSLSGPDVWLQLSNPAGGGAKAKTVRVTVTPSGFDAALAVFPGCVEACTSLTNAAGTGGAESVDVPLAVGQGAYVVVVGVSGGRGPFSATAVDL